MFTLNNGWRVVLLIFLGNIFFMFQFPFFGVKFNYFRCEIYLFTFVSFSIRPWDSLIDLLWETLCYLSICYLNLCYINVITIKVIYTHCYILKDLIQNIFRWREAFWKLKRSNTLGRAALLFGKLINCVFMEMLPFLLILMLSIKVESRLNAPCQLHKKFHCSRVYEGT